MSTVTIERGKKEGRKFQPALTSSVSTIEPYGVSNAPAPGLDRLLTEDPHADSACLCSAIGDLASSCAGIPLASTSHEIPSRRTIIHCKEWSEFATIVCKGWAISSSTLPDGRRQIHSILLPGDLVLSTGPFNPAFGHTVEAVTSVAYRKYKRRELEALILQNSCLLKKMMNIWSEARAYSNQLALSLGRRTARERIASFLLTLADTLARRGMMTSDSMEFPLRLKHIADATGLTPVHVSKVLTEFQRSGLIDLKDRSLTLLDRAELRHVAGPQ